MDPVARLVRDLERYGQPTDRWIARYSESGGCPLATAWAESRDGMAMHQLLLLVNREDLLPATQKARQLALAAVLEFGHGNARSVARLALWARVVTEMARALREAVPRPPNLLELQLAAARARRGR